LSRDSPRPLPRDPLQQKLKVAAVDPIALHDKSDQGICHLLGEWALCDADVYDISLTRDHGFAKRAYDTFNVSTPTTAAKRDSAQLYGCLSNVISSAVLDNPAGAA
jgi:hypothetical protein